jgi:hypothetical protein
MTWSFVLPAIACIGMQFQIRKMRVGWAINGFAQILWASYGFFTHQPGFILSACIFGPQNLQGYLRWKPTTDCTCVCTDHQKISEKTA